MYKKKTRCNARRNAQALAPQPFVPVAQSSQTPQAPSFVDLRVNAPPCTSVRVSYPPLLNLRAAPLPVQESVSPQEHLAQFARSLASLFALWMRMLMCNATRLRTVGTAQPRVPLATGADQPSSNAKKTAPAELALPSDSPASIAMNTSAAAACSATHLRFEQSKSNRILSGLSPLCRKRIFATLTRC